MIAIFKRGSGRQTVGLVELQETALNHGWVDTQTRRIDDDRYAIRFVPRRPGSNWSPKNRHGAPHAVPGPDHCRRPGDAAGRPLTRRVRN